MSESRTAGSSRAWTVRRARLVDIPAVSRMLRAPSLADWPLPGGVSDEDLTTATRLMLTHVGLEHGEFWVADQDGGVRAAVVLLPPAVPQDAGRLAGALRLELGLVPGLPDPTDLAELATLAGAPEMHWLLMPLHTPGDEEVLSELLQAALPAVDLTGMPVICLEQGGPAPAIRAAGFDPLVVPPELAVSASLRAGLQAPDDAQALLAISL